MRISRDKLNKLAHVVSDVLAETDECEFLEDRNTILPPGSPQGARKILPTEETLHRPGRPPQDPVSAPASSLKASQELDILYRKYYNEEVKKLGI